MDLFEGRVRAPLQLAINLLAFAGVTAANAAEEPAKAHELKEVVVTATRSEVDADQVTASVTSISRKELDRQQPYDEADLFRDEPDVAFARDMRRFGATRVNIRGLEDSRVVSMVDGVRVPEYYSGGGSNNYTDVSALGAPMDFLKRVEVLRGPASSLYGSDALGGVVGYFTLDPLDITGSEKRTGVRLKGSYNGANEAKTLTAFVAQRGETVDVLLGLTNTNASETENFGSVGGFSPGRTLPNPASHKDQGLLAKLLVRPAQGHELKLNIERRERDSDTNVMRVNGLSRVSRMNGDDEATKTRVSLDWNVNQATTMYDRVSTMLFWSKNDTHNFNEQDRTNTSATCSGSAGAGNNCYMTQDFMAEHTSYGANVKFDKAIESGWGNHFLTYGADYSLARTEAYMDGTYWNLTTGTSSSLIAGEQYPRRPFATGETTSLGLFVQDEITLANDRLTLTPGLRYDSRKLNPKVDALAQGSLTAIGQQAVSQKHDAWSPKLGALWKLNDVYSLWGQIVKGFRAPNYDEVNAAFRNTSQNYASRPNPNLQPETSVGAELGLRWSSPEVRGQFSVFNTDYKNYIENIRLAGCTAPGADPRCLPGIGTTYINDNLRKVNIHGVELRSNWQFASNWRVGGAIAHVIGKDESTGQPLNSVEPLRLSMALTYDNAVWGTEARMRAAGRKHRISDWRSPHEPEIRPQDVYFRPSGYAVFDLAAWGQISKNVRVTAGVNNVFDKKFWVWSDIRRADARNPEGVDFYTQPGRHFVAAAQVDF